MTSLRSPNRLRAITFFIAVTALGSSSVEPSAFAQQTTPTPIATPTPPTQIAKNPDFSGFDSWRGSEGGAFDPDVSASPGSGSAKLPQRGSSVFSGPIAVTPGTLYYVGAKVRQDTWPRGNITVAIQEVTPTGEWVSNLPYETAIAPYANSQFTESGLYFSPPTSIRFFQVAFIRYLEQASGDPMWIDDAFVEVTPTLAKSTTPKTGFEGSQTRVSANGNWQIREGNSWVDWFPICAAVNPTRRSVARYRTLAANGMNCDVWNGENVEALEDAKKANVRSFYQVAQYTNDQGWAVGQVDKLAAGIRAVNNSPAADYLAGFYLDNENSSDDVQRTRDVVNMIKRTDLEGGKRRRPIMQLQGNYGSLGLWSDEQGNPFSDVVGAYVALGNSGGAGSGAGGNYFLDTQPRQTQPAAYCQINDGVGVNFRASLYGCLAHGARAVSFWGDGPVDTRFPDVPYLEQQPWWPDLKAISTELKVLGPLLRQGPTTKWNAFVSGTNNLFPVTAGVRDLEGIGHMIVSNVLPTPETRTVTLSGLPYTAAEVRDYFTNALVARVDTVGQFSLTVPGAGIGSGSMVLRIVPSGWSPPKTQSTLKPTPTTKAAQAKTTKAVQTTKATKANTAKKNAAPKSTALDFQTPVGNLITATSPEALCSAGTRVQAEAATVPTGSAPLALNGTARAWRADAAPSAMNWNTTTTGKFSFRFRYVRREDGPALRTLFAVGSDGTTVSKQFSLPTTAGAWRTATVDLATPSDGPIEFSASFDITKDSGTIDLLDSVDVCPV